MVERKEKKTNKNTHMPFEMVLELELLAPYLVIILAQKKTKQNNTEHKNK